jgi:2-methylaconitate cis-trans-isomerase PrpF
VIKLHFEDPGGSVTDRLLPTDNARDRVDCPGIGEIDVSILDASNPVAFVRAKDIGLKGTEIEEIDGDTELKKRLEAIRGQCAVMLGLVSSAEQAFELSQDVPKIAVVSGPQSYCSVAGKDINEEDVDLVARIMSVGSLHRAYGVTGAICTAGASFIEDTVVHEVARKKKRDQKQIRLGHPGGQLEVEVEMEKGKSGYHFKRATVCRTARRLMDGHVYIP